ncbi:MAG: SDR family NAD(P)-dependent oxidoreductase [Candidatus Dadabacteria bacterium]|nr:SDR family NAD(P)-dependent oxidoreductase [Candidatus Dadabacteria bacterium]
MKDHVVVVTGAGRGIGRETALRFAKRAATVVICSRTPDELSRVRTEILAAGGAALAERCDVGNAAEVESFIVKASEITGTINVVVNNAGVAYTNPVTSTDINKWEEVIRTNLTGAFLVTKSALPHMRSGSHIFNLCSIAAKTGFANWAAYCASKWGLLGFTNALREEIRSSGIKVTSILPGPTDTPIWGALEGEWDTSAMTAPGVIADMILNIYTQPPESMTEEVVIMPQGGVM